MFYFPQQIGSNPVSASSLRPLAIREALSKEVTKLYAISGDREERKNKIRELERVIKNGERIDFLYFENITFPNNWSSGLKGRILYHDIDTSFLLFAKDHAIPIGYFYRDLYWKFPELITEMPKYRRDLFIRDCEYEIERLAKLVDVLFLPSNEMSKYIAEYDFKKIVDLPPGLTKHENSKRNHMRGELKLVYVGGIGNHYRFSELFSNIEEGVNILICGREKEINNIDLNHKQITIEKDIFGYDLEKRLLDADIGLLFMEPTRYWEFAVPYKLFEYMAYNLPIIASSDTWAGNFVQQEGIGWTIPYKNKEFINLTRYLLENRKEIEEKKEQIRKIAPLHTWQARARKIIETMTKLIDIS